MPEQPQSNSRPPLEVPVMPEGNIAPYAELDVTTNFSFLRGASHADELVHRAVSLGYRAIAVTDINTVAGIVRMHQAARQLGIKLLIGARLVLDDAPDLLVWAPDRAAYANLCRLLTLGRRRAPKGECILTLVDFIEHSQGLLAAMAPADVIRSDPGYPLGLLKDVMGERLSLAGWCDYDGNDSRKLQRLAEIARAHGVPMLATNHVHYHDPTRRMLQDVLTCIRHGCTIHEAGYRLFPNGERYLKPPGQMHRLFGDYPGAVRRGLEIAERCTFTLDELRYEYPDEIVPAGQRPIEYLSHLAWTGAAARYPGGIPEKIRTLIARELELIEKLRYEAYFLTVYDLVKFARSHGILCQGRGSAANSAVCYCIGVTSVDPDRIDVLFERFISAARGEPPDIDIDFEHERREEVIQYIYEKYGRERAGMTAEVISYRARSAIRDVGKAMGLGLDAVDQLARQLDWWHKGKPDDAQLRAAGLDPDNPTIRFIADRVSELLGFPRHLGQHTGGMVMTRTRLCEMVPIENAAMEDRTIIEWDKDDIEAVGFLKVDVLALGMLTCISKALDLVNKRHEGTEARRHEGFLRNRRQLTEPFTPSPGTPGEGRGEGPSEASTVRYSNRTPHPDPLPGVPGRGKEEGTPFVPPCLPLELHTIPPEDPAVYDMICDADTIGVFQIESRAQMTMLPRLRPRCFYDLVIEVAIVRPGPIQGDMVHPYLRRRNGEEPVSYPSPALEEVLKKTLGVPLFQEQAMKVVMVGAGFSADEADQLRRAMASWRYNGSIEKFHEKVVLGMLRNGYSVEFAEQLFQQICGFGEYGFPESHAASFALLVYASCWLKRYHPAAFACALLNSQPMGFYAPAQIVRDARDHGVMVFPVDVNASDWDCTLEDPPGSDNLPRLAPRNTPKSQWGRGGPALRLGFRMIKGLREPHARRIETCRQAHGRFASIDEFHRTTRLPVSVIERLAEADAFSSMPRSRRTSLWHTMALSDAEDPLFAMPDHEPDAPPSGLPAMPLGQEVMADFATAGLSLKCHPVALVRKQLDRLRITPNIRLMKHTGWIKVAGVVLIRQRPGTASGIVFITLEDETGVANLIVRPKVYEQYRAAARHSYLLQADGYVERQGQVVHVMVKRLHDLSSLLEGHHFRSRDFH